MTFYEKMRLVCLHIPRGKVATYGQIAMLCGKPRNSRQVGYGLRENLAGEDIPAFRVVNGRGELSGAQHFCHFRFAAHASGGGRRSHILERSLLVRGFEKIRLGNVPGRRGGL